MYFLPAVAKPSIPVSHAKPKWMDLHQLPRTQLIWGLSYGTSILIVFLSADLHPSGRGAADESARRNLLYNRRPAMAQQCSRHIAGTRTCPFAVQCMEEWEVVKRSSLPTKRQRLVHRLLRAVAGNIREVLKGYSHIRAIYNYNTLLHGQNAPKGTAL